MFTVCTVFAYWRVVVLYVSCCVRSKVKYQFLSDYELTFTLDYWINYMIWTMDI